MEKCICWCLSIIELKNARWKIEIWLYPFLVFEMLHRNWLLMLRFCVFCDVIPCGLVQCLPTFRTVLVNVPLFQQHTIKSQKTRTLKNTEFFRPSSIIFYCPLQPCLMAVCDVRFFFFQLLPEKRGDPCYVVIVFS